MTAYRPIDSKREEFRKYLEQNGIMDALTKALVQLYEEPDKPEDALEYLRNNLGEKMPTRKEFEEVKNNLTRANEELKELKMEIRVLKGEPPLPEETPEEEADPAAVPPAQPPA